MNINRKIALNILELPQDATIEQIRDAYRTMAKVWHPDRFHHDKKLYQRAQEKLKSINLAYEWLKNNPAVTEDPVERNYSPPNPENHSPPPPHTPSPNAPTETSNPLKVIPYGYGIICYGLAIMFAFAAVQTLVQGVIIGTIVCSFIAVICFVTGYSMFQ